MADAKNMTVVKEFNTIPDSWEDIVASCSWGSFYHTRVNLEFIKKMTGAQVCFFMAEKSGEPVGGLAYAVKKGPLGTVVNCLAYFGSYGEALAVEDAPEEVLKKIYSALIEKCRELDALSLTVITSPFANSNHHTFVQDILHPCFVDKRNCQMTILPEHCGESKDDYRERIIALFKPRVRTAVRKARQQGFIFAKAKTIYETLRLHKFHVEAIRSKGGLVKSEIFFRYAFKISKTIPERVTLALVKDGEEVAAGLVYFRFKDHVEYYIPVTNPDYFTMGPLKLLVTELMVEEGMGGAKAFNFGGTWKNQKGVYQFKRGLGASDYPYEYHTIFFRDIELLRKMNPQEIVSAYPYFFVIPFSMLGPDRI